VAAFFSCSVLGGECSNFSDSSSDSSDSSSMEELLSDFSDSSSLVDLMLISVPSLFLEDGSLRLLDDSSSEMDRGGFRAGSSLLRCRWCDTTLF
jgi:hypothetical protein